MKFFENIKGSVIKYYCFKVNNDSEINDSHLLEKLNKDKEPYNNTNLDYASFIDNNNPISHQFSFLGENDIAGNTPPKQNASTGNSREDARIESMDNDYERLIQQRNNDMSVGQAIERR